MAKNNAERQADYRKRGKVARAKTKEYPQIYDIALDEYRDVTQKDVDHLMAIARAWGRVNTQINSVLEYARGELEAQREGELERFWEVNGTRPGVDFP